jgi:diacylglycerol O-acyltransferase
MREAPPKAAKRLSADDRAILRTESPTVAGHTLKVAILEPPTGRPRPDIEALRTHIAARIERAPRLRWKLEVHARGRVEWVDDPKFDIRDHVRGRPATGSVSEDELRRICARMMQERLDRSKPLWTIDLLDPLQDGSTPLVWRIHHSMADGVMAMRLAREVLWDDGDAADDRSVAPTAPGPLGELRQSLEVRNPGRLPATLRRELASSRERSPFEGIVSGLRAVAFTSIGFGGLKPSAKRLVPEATVNDLVLVLVAGGVRRWTESRGGAPGSLRVKIPVSLHHSAERPEAANRDSFFCVSLPVATADPVERLRRISRETALRKRARDAQIVDALLRDMARLAPPVRRMLDSLLARPEAFALNVSSLKGPTRRPSVLGAPVRAFYSVADIDPQHGLRVAVISMADELHFGLCAEPNIVGGLDPLVEGIVAEAASLTGTSATSGEA